LVIGIWSIAIMALESISPIDGRYLKDTYPLAEYFSEAALIRYRIIVEGEYFLALAQSGLTGLRVLTEAEKESVRAIYNLSPQDAQIVRDIELKGYKNIKATDHDLKAIEYFLKDRLADTSLRDTLEWIHFGLTSEDANNLAYGLMLAKSLRDVILPKLAEIRGELDKLAAAHKDLPMLARTHGQPATPTTFGKEFKVFGARLARQVEQLKNYKISVKLNGASGNWNAHLAAFPNTDWITFSRDFIARLAEFRGVAFEPNLVTTQIEPHDTYAECFDILRRINTILLDFNADVWRYISDEWVVQKPKEGEVGSSTMPHKINPIKFENSEGNLGVANALFEFFGRKLPVSRLQRDLSDSTVERNFGVALGHCLVGYNYLLNGLSRITVNEAKVREELQSHPEVIAEAIQTILRREGVPMPYEELKQLTRGKTVSLEDLHRFIDGLKVRAEVKTELKKLTPENYIGLAAKLATAE